MKNSHADMKISVIIPACNEAENLNKTIRILFGILEESNIPNEIIVVDDHSTDHTREVLEKIMDENPGVIHITNPMPTGFGYAVRAGLECYSGDAVCIFMADASDDPADVVRCYRKMQEGYDCVFGSRFTSQSHVTGYPVHKLVLNRLANRFLQILFHLKFNDVTNGFKMYRREVIEGIRPILSCHFNLTIEMPLKAIVRGYGYSVIPINWHGREKGFSKLKIREMGSRYLFIALYVFLEKTLSRGDYFRPVIPGTAGKEMEKARKKGERI